MIDYYGFIKRKIAMVKTAPWRDDLEEVVQTVAEQCVGYAEEKTREELDPIIQRLTTELSEAREKYRENMYGIVRYIADTYPGIYNDPAIPAYEDFQALPTDPTHPMADLIASAELKCPECEGRGYIFKKTEPQGYDCKEIDCPACHGTGENND